MASYYKKEKKSSKIEDKYRRKQEITQNLKGEGCYVYKNNSKSDILLPKAPNNKKEKIIYPGECFEGDSYFLNLVGRGLSLIENKLQNIKNNLNSHEVALAENVNVNVNFNIQLNEVKMEEEKLLVEQPDKFTNEGQTESVMKKKTLKEVKKNKKNESQESDNVLLVEAPSNSIEIVSE